MPDEIIKAAAFWRRLDTMGSDAASLLETKTGWRLFGAATFVHGAEPARLNYEIELAKDWSTSRGVIRGFVGRRTIEQIIVRDTAGWTMNGARVAGLDQVKDLDLGFTPATNFAQLQRIRLGIEEAADFSVAWWEPGEPTLVSLPQHYQRRDERTYWYESPAGPYKALLRTGASGFVRDYPGLWVLEAEVGGGSE